MITHLLDSNTCIDHIRRGAKSKVDARLRAAAPGSVALCTVVLGELSYGAFRSDDPALELSRGDAFAAPLPLLSFGKSESLDCARIRADLAAKGTPIGPYDLMIAATARSRDLILVTHNTKEFARVPGLRLEDWQ